MAHSIAATLYFKKICKAHKKIFGNHFIITKAFYSLHRFLGNVKWQRQNPIVTNGTALFTYKAINFYVNYRTERKNKTNIYTS